jgi:hypothetical protein
MINSSCLKEYFQLHCNEELWKLRIDLTPSTFVTPTHAQPTMLCTTTNLVTPHVAVIEIAKALHVVDLTN